MEERALFPHADFSNTIDVGRIIATYSSQTVNEWFFLCKVLEKNHTDEHISDDNDHHIPAGNNYMVSNYLEKTFENFYYSITVIFFAICQSNTDKIWLWTAEINSLNR